VRVCPSILWAAMTSSLGCDDVISGHAVALQATTVVLRAHRCSPRCSAATSPSSTSISGVRPLALPHIHTLDHPARASRVSSCVITCRHISSHVIACHRMASHVLACHHVSSRGVTSRHMSLRDDRIVCPPQRRE
jgi:hypothetical protein